MGPSLLFDKSAIQSLGTGAVYEASRYFYTVIPPVLLMEILADLSLDPADLDGSRMKVAGFASKVLPIDSMAVPHYHSLCIGNLIGHHVPMDRVPVVSGAKPVTAKDGSKGFVIDVQPENEAVLRWRSGQFSEDDLKFAVEWREAATGTDFQAMRQQLEKPPFKIRTMEQVRAWVDLMLSEPDLQEPLLRWFLGFLKCDKPTYDRVCFRWRLAIRPSLVSFAPYAAHCLRVQLLYYIGMSHGILSTRSSNVVDLEYLCYTPFAFVFCSGDKLHRTLAPFILDPDQSFVDRDAMRTALSEAAASRGADVGWEPNEGSVLWQLWVKHWKKPPKVGRKAVSEEEGKRLMEKVRPIVEALEEQTARREPGPRFPA